MSVRAAGGHQHWPSRRGRTLARVCVVVASIVLVVACAPGRGSPMDDGRDGHMGPGMMSGGRSGQPPATTPLPTSTPGGSATVSYRQDVQPILSQSCVSCHGGSAGLWLDRYERVLAGSSRGPVVVPGDPEQSELYRRITGQSRPAMPLNGSPLSQHEIDVIRTWISDGAPNN